MSNTPKILQLITAVIWIVIAIIALSLFVRFIGGKGFMFNFFSKTNKEANIVASEEIDGNSVENINVNVVSESIKIYQHNEDTVKVTVYSNLPEDECPKISFDNNTLFVSKNEKRTIRLFGSFFGEVEIYIPRSFANKTTGTIDLHSTSGSVKVAGLSAEKMNFTSTSGSIKAEQISADTIYFDSTSGSVKITDVKANNISLESTSGSAKCENVIAHLVKLHSTSGSTNFQGECDGISAKTTSGSVHVDSRRAFTKDVTLNSTSGSVHLSMPENDGYTMHYSTASGSIRDDFTGTDGKGKGSYNYKNGTVNIEAKSMSGSINIKRN